MDQATDTVVQSSRDYDKFKFMLANRDQSRGHIESIKRAFEEVGNLTMVQPILVNENYEIIDGQHRFIAAKDLGEPVYFTMRPGLRVADARSMNILHRTWTVDDYAKSYAAQGDTNYITYLKLREDYGLTHSTTLMYIIGKDIKGEGIAFRRGELVIEDEALTRSRLEKLAEALEEAHIGKDKYFAQALLKVMMNPNYEHSRFMSKLRAFGPVIMRRFGTVQEYLRAIEELYNHRNSEVNRVQLY